MKDIFTLKKITGFKPELHWKLIIVFAFFLVLCSAVYATYLYVSAKNQVYIDRSSRTATTTAHAQLKTFSSAQQMEELFEIYKQKGVLYQGAIKRLTAKEVVLQATTSVATSSKQ